MGGLSKAFEHASVAILYVEPGMPLDQIYITVCLLIDY
jgi:hypothetical protein